VFGISIIFIAPPLILLLLAIVVGAWRFSKRGAKAAATSVVRIIVYGSFVLFVLFMAVLAMYYSGGGH
jgi:cytochrome c oxidase assembly factor CtaG